MLGSRPRLNSTLQVSNSFRRRMPLLALGFSFAGGCASGTGQPATTSHASTEIDSGSDPVDAIIRMHVPGLIVSRTADGGIALQLSDPPASIDRENTPLYLIDETPFEPGPNGELAGINPGDIASIKVLRRVSAAIYGLRGANGVIAITTKRAATPKK